MPFLQPSVYFTFVSTFIFSKILLLLLPVKALAKIFPLYILMLGFLPCSDSQECKQPGSTVVAA